MASHIFFIVLFNTYRYILHITLDWNKIPQISVLLALLVPFWKIFRSIYLLQTLHSELDPTDRPLSPCGFVSVVFILIASTTAETRRGTNPATSDQNGKKGQNQGGFRSMLTY